MSKTSKNMPYRRELCAALALALPFGAMAATTIMPANVTTGPSVTQTGGKGVVVGIVAPNGAGVSHNQFTQFDVGAEGVVLNNSSTSVASQLAGQIAGNANLANGAASVIIAEVTGNAASQLNGAMEVAGQKAAIVVANPNGISANGLSFINASRATLSTGTAVIKDKLDPNIPAGFTQPAVGTLTGLNIDKGVITVTGKGIDATGVDIADLFARAVSLNAELKAKTLTVVTGPTVASYGMNGGSIGTARPHAVEGAAPKLALDVSAMGGMYANAIRMEGTETGVGVNVAGTISAKNQANLNTGGALNIAKGGSVKSEGVTNLKVGTHVFNAGTISAGAAGVSIASTMPDYSATLDSKDGEILAPTGQVAFKNFGHKRVGVLTSSNSNLASDNQGNTIAANSQLDDGNGEAATLTPPTTTPVEPSKPEEPATPVEPSKPEQPTTPAEPSKPEQPTTPVEPSKPEQPTTPVEPSKPEQPTTPVEPSKPEQPTTPVEPSKPEQPTTPVEPSKPEQPTTPVEPSKPEQPTTPVEPSKPEQPTTPVEPSKPEQPTTPVKPSKPEQPTTPVEPAKPEQPVTPVEKPKPVDDQVSIFVQQLLDQIFSRPIFGYTPWGYPSFGYAPWNRPAYGGYSSWNAPAYGNAPWMPSFFRPQPVFSPWRPTAYNGFNAPRWR
jgi:filamentous hemagglutinin family protein